MFTEISKNVCNLIIKDLNYDDQKREWITYAIETSLLTVVNFLAILVIAYVFQTVMPTVVAALAGGGLRRVSGGAHFNTPLKCMLFGTAIYNAIGVLAKSLGAAGLYNTYIFVFLTLISLLATAVLAPVDSKGKPIHSKTLRRNLKISSVLFIACAIPIIIFNKNGVITLSFLLGVVYQTITLLPLFNKKGGAN